MVDDAVPKIQNIRQRKTNRRRATYLKYFISRANTQQIFRSYILTVSKETFKNTNNKYFLNSQLSPYSKTERGKHIMKPIEISDSTRFIERIFN